MVWLWRWPKGVNFSAEFCGFDPQPEVKGLSIFSTEQLPSGTRAILKSRYSLKNFLKLHNLPAIDVTVDRLWRDIILKFVPSDRVQFVPARLTARGKTSDEFFVMLPFDRVIGIDKHRSAISDMLETAQGTRIFDIDKLVLTPNCLSGLHLARDEQNVTFLYISDELRDALAATGQDNPFYTVEEYNRKHSDTTEH